MKFQDLFITPIYFLMILGIAYRVRRLVVNAQTKAYFIPGFLIKCFGAISLGMIYQFYYGGGDTFNYFDLGSQWIWRAFLDDPLIAMSLIFGDMEMNATVFNYASRIYYFGDAGSYAVVRLAGFLDIFTFHTYSATALFFTVISYTGMWMIFSAFQKVFPSHTRLLALSILFFPSLFFWGSGLIKDSLTIAAVGWMFWAVVEVIHFNRRYAISILLFLLGFYVLYVIKIYILLCLLPAFAFWVYRVYSSKIRNIALRYLLAPVLFIIFVVFSYFAIINVSSDSRRYSIDSVFITAEETARWNYYVSEQQSGSGYNLGGYDFSPTGLVAKFFPAVFTSFFRPFLFEAQNPLMLLSALENTVILFLFLRILLIPRLTFQRISHPVILFAVVFSVLFAFSIGVTTYNFGSLVRYKIPMLAFLTPILLLVSSRRPLS